ALEKSEVGKGSTFVFSLPVAELNSAEGNKGLVN
ncbi:MAG: hypothetical protein UY11_C0051G0006, partial [Candidatus Amesbacteria bacterium GW2011_GWC2_47_8]